MSRRKYKEEMMVVVIDRRIKGNRDSSANLVVRGKLLYAQDGGIHVLNVVQVGEHKRFFHVKTTSNDVLGILIR